MDPIKVFTSPDSVCYTFVFFSILSVFTGYTLYNVEIEIEEKILWLLILFGILSGLILLCKLVHRISVFLDRLFDE